MGMLTRTATRLAALLLPLALVAAACTNDDDGDSGDTTAATTTEAAPVTTPAATTTAAPADPVFQLGVVVPPPGLTSELFTAQLRGVDFAQSDIDSGGGVLGAPLGVIEQQVPLGGGSPAIADDLVAAGAGALLGPDSSDAAKEIVPTLQRVAKAACSASVSAPYATAGQEEGLVFFRTVVPDQWFTAELANEIIARRDAEAPGEALKVAIVARADAYGQNVGGALASLLGAAGLAPTVVAYNPNTVIFDSTAADVAAVDPDLSVLVTYEEGTRLLAALVAAGIPADTMVGLDAFFIPRLTEVVGGDPADIEGFSVFGTPGDNAFLQRLLDENPTGQVAFAAQAYDCTVVLALAAAEVEAGNAATLGEASRSVTEDGRTCTTYEDCLSKLTSGEDIDYDGVTGNLALDASGNVTFARFTTGKVIGGELTQVASRDVDIARQAEIDALTTSVTTAAAFTTQLQISLKLLGFYTGPINGQYDDATRAAVAAFQTSVGLPATGEYDAATDEALRARLGSLADVLSTSTEDLQRTLTDLGYYEGPIDGQWSPELTAAIKAFQADLGVPQTGVLDVATVRAIYQQGVTTGSTTTTVPATTAAPTTPAPTTAPPTTPAPTTAPPPQTTPPPDTTAPPVETTPSQPDPEPLPSIFEVLQANEDQFSTLITILEALGVDEGLSPLPVTFFAPTNDAFAAAGIDPADFDLTDPAVVATVRQLLAYHVVQNPRGAVYVVGAAPPGVLTEPIVLGEPQELVTLQGGSIVVSGSGTDVRLNQTTGIVGVVTNLVASNGIVQGINEVLTPVEPLAG